MYVSNVHTLTTTRQFMLRGIILLYGAQKFQRKCKKKTTQNAFYL